MSQFCFITNSEADTERLGAAMAANLRPRDVIALRGKLGAGKTRLVRAILASLHGTDAAVSSPTFVLVQRYDGPVSIDHIDAYRLAGSDEFLDLGGDEILADESVCLIEWADRVIDVLPDDHVQVAITVTSETSRQFDFSGRGERSSEVVAQIQHDLASGDQ